MSLPDIVCDYCGKDALYLTGRDLYPQRVDLATKRFWVCWPCEAWVGCHGNGPTPLGRLANAELRRAKGRAHAAFDALWSSRSQRASRYAWLAQALGIPARACHIGMFDVATCERVVEACQRENERAVGELAP